MRAPIAEPVRIAAIVLRVLSAPTTHPTTPPTPPALIAPRVLIAQRERKPLTPAGIALRVVFGVLVVALVAVVGGFSCFRWLLNDDASDFQGTWYVAGTDTPISISADAIALNGEVSYGYTLDASAKTVAFTFSDLSGAGHYRFSLDRQYLAIMDGSFGWWDTLSDDFGWTANALILSAQGQQASPAGAENVTLLSRTPASQTA